MAAHRVAISTHATGSAVTDIGIAVLRGDGSGGARHLHYRVVEHQGLATVQSRTGFIFGITQRIPRAVAAKHTLFWIKPPEADSATGVHLVALDIERDCANLALLGIDVSDISAQFSISEMFRLLHRDSPPDPDLETILAKLKIPFNRDALYDAGNDAAYILKAYEAMESSYRESLKSSPLRSKSFQRKNNATRAMFEMKTIFAQGGFKNVYRGVYIAGDRIGQACVAKTFKSGGVVEEEYFDAELRIVTRAQEIVDAFNSAGCFTGGQVVLNVPEVWTFLDATTPKYVGQKALIEPMIESFCKFNSNTGWTLRADDIPWNQVVQALSHFSFHHTRGSALLCDLQGGVVVNGGGANTVGTLVITDPVIMSPTRAFGPTDLGNRGISSFFSTHSCNAFCRDSWLLPEDRRVYYAPVEGSTMEQSMNAARGGASREGPLRMIRRGLGLR